MRHGCQSQAFFVSPPSIYDLPLQLAFLYRVAHRSTAAVLESLEVQWTDTSYCCRLPCPYKIQDTRGPKSYVIWLKRELDSEYQGSFGQSVGSAGWSLKLVLTGTSADRLYALLYFDLPLFFDNDLFQVLRLSRKVGGSGCDLYINSDSS